MQHDHSTATSGNSISQTARPFNPFGMFNGVWIPDVMLRYPHLGPAAKLVYARLTRFLGKHGGPCYPKISSIAEDLGLSDRQVQRYLKDLETQGFIRRTVRRRENGSQTSNGYCFLEHAIFTTVPDQTGVTKVSPHPVTEMSPPEEKTKEEKKVKTDLEQLPQFRNTSETASASAPAQSQTQSQNLNTPELASELERYFGEKPSARTLEQIAQKAREYHVTAADVGALLRSLEREGYGRKDRKRPYTWAWVLTTITDRLQRRKAQLEAHQMAGENHWNPKHAQPPLSAADVLPLGVLELDTEVTHALFKQEAA